MSLFALDTNNYCIPIEFVALTFGRRKLAVRHNWCHSSQRIFDAASDCLTPVNVSSTAGIQGRHPLQSRLSKKATGRRL